MFCKYKPVIIHFVKELKGAPSIIPIITVVKASKLHVVYYIRMELIDFLSDLSLIKELVQVQSYRKICCGIWLAFPECKEGRHEQLHNV